MLETIHALFLTGFCRGGIEAEKDCDVTLLKRSDFEFACSLSTPRASVMEYVDYEVDILSPSRSVGRIGQYRPSKSRRPLKRRKLRGELAAWKESLHQCPGILFRSGENMIL